MMASRTLFNTQLHKGRTGEHSFKTLALNHYDEVTDYTDYNKHRDIQKRGIDFGFKMNNWATEITCDVKTNLYHQDNAFYTGYVFSIEYEKWCDEAVDAHNRKSEMGWIQDSKANRIYHFERGTDHYLYYDLDDMRKFIYKEWDRPTNNWIKDLSYIAGYNSDFARIIPVRLNDTRFTTLIRKINKNTRGV
jgi:hypothetical protein